MLHSIMSTAGATHRYLLVLWATAFAAERLCLALRPDAAAPAPSLAPCSRNASVQLVTFEAGAARAVVSSDAGSWVGHLQLGEGAAATSGAAFGCLAPFWKGAYEPERINAVSALASACGVSSSAQQNISAVAFDVNRE